MTARAVAARAVATGFGLGLAPVAPGTVASVAALVAGALLRRGAPPAVLPLASVAAVVGGVLAARALPDIADDPGAVVIDEIAGQWIALLGVAPGRRGSAAQLAAAFALFRALDIAKPGPVGWADRRRGAVAVVADDVIAGLLAALLLRIARRAAARLAAR